MTAMTEIAKEYGAALFMLACEENSKAEYSDALECVKAVFSQNPVYLDFLASPSISLNDRLSALDAAFGDSVPTNVMSFIKLMCERGRIADFWEAAKEFELLFEASERLLDVKVTSAVELTEKEKQDLNLKLEAKYKAQVDVEYSIDSAILGGLIVEADGKIIDGSLRHRLQEVKEVMNK